MYAVVFGRVDNTDIQISYPANWRIAFFLLIFGVEHSVFHFFCRNINNTIAVCMITLGIMSFVYTRLSVSPSLPTHFVFARNFDVFSSGQWSVFRCLRVVHGCDLGAPSAGWASPLPVCAALSLFFFSVCDFFFTL